MTTIRTTLVALAATTGLTLGLVSATAVAAEPAAAATKKKAAKPKLQRVATVKVRVASRKGAVLYSTRTGKVIRDKRDRARRLSSGVVKVVTHRGRFKGRDYRRLSGTRYMVRTSTLRVVPKVTARPRPVTPPKPPVLPKPVPKPPVQPSTPTTVPMPTAVKGPFNGQAKTLVFGDSISDPTSYGERQPGNTPWWAVLQTVLGTNMHVKAHGGTGMLNTGCWIGVERGPFGIWLSEIERVKPDFVIVEGGRNDFMDCVTPATAAMQEDAILGYMADLAGAADANGIPRDRVYVYNAWGTGQPELRDPIVSLMRKGATENGLRFLEMPVMGASLTTDTVHPNADGSRWLATQFLARSDYAQRLAAWTPAP